MRVIAYVCLLWAIACAPTPTDLAREQLLWASGAYPTVDPSAGRDVQGRALTDDEQAVVDGTLACLADLPAPLPEAWQGDCYAWPFDPVSAQLDSSELTIYVEPEPLTSCRTGEQMLRWEAPCDPTKPRCSADSTCHWRSMVRDNVLLTTPDLWMLPDAVVRWATTCHNPWAVPEIAACASPHRGTR